ncbi:serine-rich adhesin for platelets [Musca vetustissima]|uniref:serine-rich adhesin for platelets n=1 Tax=Musca vetustissima TaxID=27455 RepID=UPI002AB7025C|nr:serine-rich adhesin for platelets [Musca vetustissima]
MCYSSQGSGANHCNFYDVYNDDDIQFEYHDMKINRQQQQTSSQLMLIPTIMTTNANNHQQQQHTQQQHPHQQQLPYDVVHDNATNVEAVILQNQVDTLHWQLKQVETSCDMYRAVMEEVARFLERYQKQRQIQQQKQQQDNMEKMSRSKSLYQVNSPSEAHDKSMQLCPENDSSASYLRVRSSTNLIDLKQNECKKNNKSSNAKTSGCHSKDDHNFETSLAPSQSYSAFKDFTWRRSPKKSNDSKSHSVRDDADEKLSQEAFRLHRTIQNLLNTSQHQTELLHPPPQQHHHHHQMQRQSLAACGGVNRISKAMSTTSVATLPGAPMHNSTSLTLATNCAASTSSDSSATSPTIAATSNTLAPDMLFLRSANMRDSRLSLRSSTDSSVHSTSSSVASSASSKVETDEEPTTPFHSPPNMLAQHKPHIMAGSSTEDESGFSSISSFPDIGVPHNSTMLAGKPPQKCRNAKGNELKSFKANNDSKQQTQQQSTADNAANATLKANVVGLPLNSSQDMSHRWDTTPSKTYHNASTKFQRFSALSNNEDSNTVLWV